MSFAGVVVNVLDPRLGDLGIDSNLPLFKHTVTRFWNLKWGSENQRFKISEICS